LSAENELLDSYNHYHHQVRELGGVIHEADKEPATIFDIVAEPRYDGKLSAFAYSFSCVLCGESVLSKDRSRLGSKGEVRTLCESHFNQVNDLRMSISEAHRKVNKAIKAENKEIAKSIRWDWIREKRKAENGPPPPPPSPPKKPRYSGPARKGYVYRLFDAKKRLLYVGKSWNVDARFYGTNGHASSKPWWNDVKFAAIEEYKTEASALKAEAHIIKKERPRYNIAQPVVPATRKPSPVTWTLRELENGKTIKETKKNDRLLQRAIARS